MRTVFSGWYRPHEGGLKQLEIIDDDGALIFIEDGDVADDVETIDDFEFSYGDTFYTDEEDVRENITVSLRDYLDD